MKKLLFVILVLALTAFLSVGCLPVTPAEGEGEGEGEGELCPTVAVTSQVVVEGKTYIKGGEQTITVTFANPTVPVSVYVGRGLQLPIIPNGVSKGVPDNAIEVVMYPDEEKKIYTGTFNFKQVNVLIAPLNAKQTPIASFCPEDYIYVSTCDTCAPCKYPYIVDSCPPYAKIEITAEDCDCEGCEITFESIVDEFDCESDEECCGDDCSGLASWSVVLYDAYPLDECDDLSVCEEPIDSCSGTDCSIGCTTECLTEGTYYAVITLVDNVGLEEVYYVEIDLGADCGLDILWATICNFCGALHWYPATSDTIGYCHPNCLSQIT